MYESRFLVNSPTHSPSRVCDLSSLIYFNDTTSSDEQGPSVPHYPMRPQTVEELDRKVDQDLRLSEYPGNVNLYIEEGKANQEDLDKAYIAYGKAALLHQNLRATHGDSPKGEEEHNLSTVSSSRRECIC